MPSSASRRAALVPELVVAERGEELAAAGEPRDLARDHRAAAGRLATTPRRVDDLPGCGQLGHARELDPLDVSDDGASHNSRTLPRFNR